MKLSNCAVFSLGEKVNKYLNRKLVKTNKQKMNNNQKMGYDVFDLKSFALANFLKMQFEIYSYNINRKKPMCVHLFLCVMEYVNL